MDTEVDFGQMFDSILTICAQVKEEPEVSDNRPSLLVYPYPPGTHQALHKVRGHCNSEI